MSETFRYSTAAKLAPVAFLFGLQFGIIGPVLTELIKQRVCAQTFGFSTQVCANLTDGFHHEENSQVSSSTAGYVFLEKIGVCLPSFLFALLTGSWSDRFGHKRAITIPTLGMMFGGILLIGLAYVPTHPAAFVAFSLVQTSLGGFSLAGAALYSYLGDHCSPEVLASNIAIFDGIMFLSGSIGEMSCGYLYRHFGFPFPVILYTMCFALVVLYVTLTINGAFTKADQEASQTPVLFTTKNLKDNRDFLLKERIGNTSRHIKMLITSAVIGHICVQGSGSIHQLFFETAPLNWTMERYAMLLAMSDILSGVLMMAGVPFLTQVLHLSDIDVGITGITSAILSLAILSITTKTWMAIVFVIVGSLCRMQFTAVRSLLSSFVHHTERGKIMSIIAVYEALMPLAGSLVFASLFSATVFWWSGFAFAFGAVVMLVPWAAFRYVDIDRQKPLYTDSNELVLPLTNLPI